MQQLDTALEIGEGLGRIRGVTFAVEWSAVVGRGAVRGWLVAEDGEKVRLSWETTQKIGPNGDGMPVARLRFMFPMVTKLRRGN
jgi:hypothetical protein